MNYIKKALPFLKVFFLCLGDAGRGVSGGKTVSCDQVAFGKNVFVNIVLRSTEGTGADFPDALLAGVKTREFCL